MFRKGDLWFYPVVFLYEAFLLLHLLPTAGPFLNLMPLEFLWLYGPGLGLIGVIFAQLVPDRAPFSVIATTLAILTFFSIGGFGAYVCNNVG